MNYRDIAQDAIDEAIPNQATLLSEHDRRYHPNGYEEGQFCRFRESLKRGDSADDLQKAEDDEKKSFEELDRYMNRLVNLGRVIMSFPQKESSSYDAVLNQYGFLKGDTNYDEAKEAIVRACEDYDDLNESGDEDWELKSKVLDTDTVLHNLKHGGKAAKPIAPSQPIAPSKPSPQEIKDIADLRNDIERVARLLNGRVGNVKALQSSSRWPALQAMVAHGNAVSPKLAKLEASSDPEISRAAKTLKKIHDELVASSKAGWTNKVSNVPSIEDL